ncbi:molecular chaperone DnaJ, partial [candidate division WWE3 bacterium CG_4_9_14_3_um_filter_41_6]
MQSYYEILGISAKASDAEIKSAYKKLAKKYHPDVNKEASAKNTFQQVSKAYQILSDPQKRAAYDRMGHDTFEQAQKG